MKINPRHLAQLSMITEAGSFQSASERLDVSQPALTRNMQTLESQLGAALFRREGRRAVPTRLGLGLAQSGLAIREAEEQAVFAADKSREGYFGELRIGAPPIVAGRFLTKALSQFITANPSCAVELRTGLVHELRTMLSRGQIDLVLGPQVLAHQGSELTFQQLIDDRVGILCRINHPLTKHKTILATDLQNQHWLSHSRGSLLRQQTETALIASGISSIQTGIETDSIRTALEIVASTDLITTMPRVTTSPYLEDKLQFLAFDHPQFQRPIGAIRRAGALHNEVEEAFLRLLSIEKQ